MGYKKIKRMMTDGVVNWTGKENVVDSWVNCYRLRLTTLSRKENCDKVKIHCVEEGLAELNTAEGGWLLVHS